MRPVTSFLSSSALRPEKSFLIKKTALIGVLMLPKFSSTIALTLRRKVFRTTALFATFLDTTKPICGYSILDGAKYKTRFAEANLLADL